MSGLRRAEIVTGYLFVSPAMLWLLVFVAVPAGLGVFLSFFRWTGLGERQYIGLANYAALVHDGQFLHSLLASVEFIVFFVCGTFIGALLLALLLAHPALPLQGLFRVLYYLPNMLPAVVVALVWTFMYDPTFGILNQFLAWLRLPGTAWLSASRSALPALAAAYVWWSMGYYIIIFLAGLLDIPRELYEAAHIDGAGPAAAFRWLTWPLLGSINTFVVISCVIQAFGIFALVFVMTQGGPNMATDVIIYHIYSVAFQYGNLGYASAMATVLFLVVAAITIVQLRLLGAFAAEPS